MQQAGGKTIVELTVGGLKPDPEGLIGISKATDTHIVMGCGHYVDEYQDPANRERSVDDFATEMVGQIYEGAFWGSDARAGLIGEIGCQSPWTDLEKRVMEGALIAQKGKPALRSTCIRAEIPTNRRKWPILSRRGAVLCPDSSSAISIAPFSMTSAYFDWRIPAALSNSTYSAKNNPSTL